MKLVSNERNGGKQMKKTNDDGKIDYTLNKFTLEGKTVHSPYSDDADIQWGADFHLEYAGAFKHKPNLGIMQFVKSETQAGNPPIDMVSGIAIDHRIVAGRDIPAVEYLFGGVNKKLSYQGSVFDGEFTAIREENKAGIYDCPREPAGVIEVTESGFSRTITFWDFIAEIENDYIRIYDTIGIVWGLELNVDKSNRSCTVKVVQPKEVSFSSLPYKRLFAAANIKSDTYQIINGNK
jgi:hypothetical protein